MFSWAYVFLFFAGLAGSLHCVGMCGMFPWTLAAHAPDRPIGRQVLYNLGRLNTLVCIGAVSGALGAVLVGTMPIRIVERALALVTGIFMMVVALEMLGVMQPLTGRMTASMQRRLLELLRDVMRSRSWRAPRSRRTRPVRSKSFAQLGAVKRSRSGHGLLGTRS